MLSKVHFISGLPRSGSTLLAAILRQNPRFHADIASPLAPLCGAVHQKIGAATEFSRFFDEERSARILRGLFDSFYAHLPEGTAVVFDTNRSWTARAALLGVLYPECKIICCVRDIGWIIDSIERMRLQHPLKLSKLFAGAAAESLYSRVDALMNSESGLVGAAWSTLREAWFSGIARRLVVVRYDGLVRDPERTMRRLYREIGESYFAHSFVNVDYEARDYDESLGMPGLHTVRRVVEYRERQPVVPPDIFSRYAQTHFWDDPELNPRRVVMV
jgi:sulfotransferase